MYKAGNSRCECDGVPIELQSQKRQARYHNQQFEATVKLSNTVFYLEVLNWHFISCRSLSHIFPASKFDEEKCAFKHMEEGERQKVFSAVYSGVNIRKTTANTLVYCKDVADVSIFQI